MLEEERITLILDLVTLDKCLVITAMNISVKAVQWDNSVLVIVFNRVNCFSLRVSRNLKSNNMFYSLYKYTTLLFFFGIQNF